MHFTLKNISLLLILTFLASCKSKQAAITATTTSGYLSAKEIIKKHYDNKNNFSTLYIKSNAQYSDDKQTQNVTAEIKIKKDEQILISVRFLGITMAKALITPKSVSYYEKINGSYFEGDFSSLSQWLGADLDFDKIQNMLLGEAIDDLNKGKYKESLLEPLYRLDDLSNGKTQKSFFMDQNTFRIKKQEMTKPSEERMMQIVYADEKEFANTVLPSNIMINTYQKKGKNEIRLSYNTITFNEELSFPYSVPDGYKRIIIK